MKELLAQCAAAWSNSKLSLQAIQCSLSESVFCQDRHRQLYPAPLLRGQKALLNLLRDESKDGEEVLSVEDLRKMYLKNGQVKRQASKQTIDLEVLSSLALFWASSRSLTWKVRMAVTSNGSPLLKAQGTNLLAFQAELPSEVGQSRTLQAAGT